MDNSSSNNIGQFLRSLRGKRSLREIQQLSGVSYTQLRNLELGKDPRSGNPIVPTPETLKKLAKAYNYPYLELAEMASIISSEEKEMALRNIKIYNPIGFGDSIIREFYTIRRDEWEGYIPSIREIVSKYTTILGEDIGNYINNIESFTSRINKITNHLANNSSYEDLQEFIKFYEDIILVPEQLKNRKYPKKDLYFPLHFPLALPTYKGKELTKSQTELIISLLEEMIDGDD